MGIKKTTIIKTPKDQPVSWNFTSALNIAQFLGFLEWKTGATVKSFYWVAFRSN